MHSFPALTCVKYKDDMAQLPYEQKVLKFLVGNAIYVRFYLIY